MQAEATINMRGDRRPRSLTSLDWRRTVLVTLPFMGALTFWQAYDGLVPLTIYPMIVEPASAQATGR